MSKPRHPFTALPDNLFGILKGHEWAVMMALAHHGYSSYPSQQRISKLAGISLTTTQKVLNSLKEKGLVEWEHRKREDGGQGSNLYKLTIDHLWNPEGVSATRVPPTRDTGTPHPRDTDEQDLLEPDLKELEEPPTAPLPRGEVPRGRGRGESKRERVSRVAMAVYNAGKPKAWAGRTIINDTTWDLISYWLKQLGEEDLIRRLKETLEYVNTDKWWREKNLGMDSIFRKRGNYLIEMPEKLKALRSKTMGQGCSKVDPSTLTDYESLFGG